MTREEKLIELARITKRLRDWLGSECLPEPYVRGYNQLMYELYGLVENPESQEAKHGSG